MRGKSVEASFLSLICSEYIAAPVVAILIFASPSSPFLELFYTCFLRLGEGRRAGKKILPFIRIRHPTATGQETAKQFDWRKEIQKD